MLRAVTVPPPPPLGKHTCAHSTCIQAKAHQGNCTHAAQVLNLDPVQTEQLPQGRQLPMGCPHARAGAAIPRCRLTRAAAPAPRYGPHMVSQRPHTGLGKGHGGIIGSSLVALDKVV